MEIEFLYFCNFLHRKVCNDMSDMWEKDPSESSNVPESSAAPTESTAPETPAQPATPPAEPTPQTPPTNGFSPDGSYRYVPPRTAQIPPTYSTPPQTPPPSNKAERGWLVVVAVLAALAVIISGIVFAFRWLDYETKAADKDKTSQGDKDSGTKPSGGSGNHQDLVITPGNKPDDIDPDKDYYYGDGGLSTETIVKKNYDSTVVLTMYAEDTYHYLGDDSLQEVGAGSGIVWTKDGYIITNCHCVINEETGEKFDRIDVTMYDGTVYEDAKVIGADSSTDLAVIKVDATDLTPAEFGNSDELAVGSRVVALGNAAGLAWTATQGIVSAKARDVYEDTGYAIQCLQVDVAINGGNSGGPLLNKYGQVVAINSAKIAASGYEGLGFSIPIIEAKPVLESLLEHGYVKGRVALGVTGATYDDGYYQGFKIQEILKGSCLEGTKAENYDVVVISAVDGVKVVDYGTLRAELAKHKVGDKVILTLLCANRRSNEVETVKVEVVLQEQTAQ